jgi:hypothetical protein
MGTAAGFGGEAMGLELHGRDSESHGGTHCVAPVVEAELKAQSEAKFHRYCFGFS